MRAQRPSLKTLPKPTRYLKMNRPELSLMSYVNTARALSKAFSRHQAGNHPMAQDTSRERNSTVIFPIFLILFLVGEGSQITAEGLIKRGAAPEDRIWKLSCLYSSK